MGEGEVLSQGEVDAFLRGVGDGEVETETDEAPDEDTGVVPYDLTSQEKIIRGRLPTLDDINQMFSRLFKLSFGTLMRKSINVSTVSTDTIKFGDFLRSLPIPSSLHIFRMEPLRGHGLMLVENKLVFAVVDTFFGGAGTNFGDSGIAYPRKALIRFGYKRFLHLAESRGFQFLWFRL